VNAGFRNRVYKFTDGGGIWNKNLGRYLADFFSICSAPGSGGLLEPVKYAGLGLAFPSLLITPLFNAYFHKIPALHFMRE
jgi:hypothetical protein